jgi:hypothetical protein
MALAALAVAGIVAPAAAQLEPNLGALSDENAKGYLGPLATGLSATMNSAIFQTGYVPKTGVNFLVGVRVMGITFDDADRTYTPTDPPGFESTQDVDAPTVIGDTKSVEQPGQSGTVLYHPGGFDIENFTVAVPQLSIGSFMGTRAVLRYISIDLGDSDLGEFSLFGIGAQHSISQYFVNMPVDVAAGLFYQQFSIGEDLVDTKALHLNVTGSRRFGIAEPYLGLGYDTFDMTAKYTSGSGAAAQTVEVEFDKESNAHLTFGIRANVAFVMVHAEYNIAAENAMAVGLSFGM